MTRIEYARCDRPGCRSKTEEDHAKRWYRLTVEYPREGREQAWDVCSPECLRKLLRAMADGEVDWP